MGYAINLEVPEEIYRPLLDAAAAANQTPEEWLLFTLRRQFAVPDTRLRRHFGVVNLGKPTGADNESIDADLARAYAGSDE